jgi:hypothetical protein
MHLTGTFLCKFKYVISLDYIVEHQTIIGLVSGVEALLAGVVNSI